MKNLPENWSLVEAYDGNLIFEDKEEEFQISIDSTGQLQLPYPIGFAQPKGTFNKISFEADTYSSHAFTETEAKSKAL